MNEKTIVILGGGSGGVVCANELRKKLSEKGFLQIKKYSWETLAKKTLEIYKNEEKKRGEN